MTVRFKLVTQAIEATCAVRPFKRTFFLLSIPSRGLQVPEYKQMTGDERIIQNTPYDQSTLTRDYIRARDAHFYLLSRYLSNTEGTSISLEKHPRNPHATPVTHTRVCINACQLQTMYQCMSITNHVVLRSMHNWIEHKGAINAKVS